MLLYEASDVLVMGALVFPGDEAPAWVSVSLPSVAMFERSRKKNQVVMALSWLDAKLHGADHASCLHNIRVARRHNMQHNLHIVVGKVNCEDSIDIRNTEAGIAQAGWPLH